MIEMDKRRADTQLTLDEWRGRGFDWNSRNDGTCAHLLAAHMRNRGHNPPEIPEFDGIRGAVKALNSLGWSDLTEWLDDLLERRPSVGFMRLGDVALAQGDGPLDAIFICAGPLKVFGWHETRDELVVMDVALDKLIGAWAT